MGWKTGLLIAVTVVLLIILAVVLATKKDPGWMHLEFWKAHLVDTPDEIYQRSAGGYDEAADLALRRSEGMPNPSPADHFRAGTIIYRNIISQTPQARVAPDGNVPEEDLEGEIIRRDMFGRAREHYRQTLEGLTVGEVARDEADRAARRFNLRGGGDDGAEAPRGEVPGRPGAGFIIDAVLEFAHEGFAALLGGRREVAEGDVLFVDGELVELAGGRRETTLEVRKAAAEEIAEGKGKGAQAGAFLDLSQRNTSDSQNSHDPSVNAAKRATVARLRESQGDVDRLPTLDQISDEIRAGGENFSRDPRTGYPRPVLVDRALAVVTRGRNGETSSSAAATDAEVLRRVWARSYAPENADNGDLLRQAIFDGLVDSWELGFSGDRIQCVDGRISRMIGSLVMLDADTRNWDVKRLEARKNEVFTLAARVIRLSAEAAAADGDPTIQAVGRSYLSEPELAVDDKVEEAWIEETRESIRNAIDAHVAEANRVTPGAFPDYIIGDLKKEAAAAI